jgi:hypothetical protein
MATSVQFCWPSTFRNLAAYVQDLVAADTEGKQTRRKAPGSVPRV